MNRTRAGSAWRMLIAGALIASLGLAAARPRPAHACSAGPDYNPVTASDLIVAGRVTGWELTEPDPSSERAKDGRTMASVSPRVTLVVDRVLKGRAPGELTFRDAPGGIYVAEAASARYPQYSFWVGGCASFLQDPTGSYVVLGLSGGDGVYAAHRTTTFFVDDGPGGPVFERVIARLTAADPSVLPATGVGMVADTDWRARSADGALVGVTLTLVLGAACLRRRRPKYAGRD